MSDLATIEETEKAIEKDTVTLVAATGDEAIPGDAGEGYAVTTTAGGGLQLAFYWTDPLTGERHTTLIAGGMLRFFDSLADTLHQAVKSARKRKVIQLRGVLTPGSGSSS